MKTRLIYGMTVALLLAVQVGTAWSQTTSSKVEGRITDGGKPVANVEVVLTNLGNGKIYKIKTDKNGQFLALGVEFGDYRQEVIGASGEKLYEKQVRLSGAGGEADNLSAEIGSGGGSQGKMTKEQRE